MPTSSSFSSSAAAATRVLVKLSPLDVWWWNASCAPCVGSKYSQAFVVSNDLQMVVVSLETKATGKMYY